MSMARQRKADAPDGATTTVRTVAKTATRVHVDLRAGEAKPTVVRANPQALARAKKLLGYKSNQEMVIDLIQNAVDEEETREERVHAQRKALSMLDDLDVSDLAEVTQFRPVERTV
jgi:hypothetical protein